MSYLKREGLLEKYRLDGVSQALIFCKLIMSYLFIVSQWLFSHQKQHNPLPTTIQTNNKKTREEPLYSSGRQQCLLQIMVKIWSWQHSCCSPRGSRGAQSTMMHSAPIIQADQTDIILMEYICFGVQVYLLYVMEVHTYTELIQSF